MRFLTLALGAVGLAAFAVSETISNVESSTSSTVPSLSRWHPSETVSACSFQTTSTQANYTTSREEPSLTLPVTTTCSNGSTLKLYQSPTSVCTEPATTSCDNRPCASSRYAYYVCVTTMSSDFGGTRTRRFVAQYAAATRATVSTQVLGGHSLRVVARFAEPTITSAPTAAAADPPFPTCSFDLEKGKYICPDTTPKTHSSCSFNPKKGQYVYPTPAATVTSLGTSTPALQPCSICFGAIELCQDKCKGDQDCIRACPCNIYPGIPSCSQCRSWKTKCEGLERAESLRTLEKKTITTMTAIDTGSDVWLPNPWVSCLCLTAVEACQRKCNGNRKCIENCPCIVGNPDPRCAGCNAYKGKCGNN